MHHLGHRSLILLVLCGLLVSCSQGSLRPRVAVPPDIYYPPAASEVHLMDWVQQVRSLYGRVIDPSGAPVPNVIVEVTGDSATRTVIAATLTDEKGRFEFVNSRCRHYYLRFRRPGFATMNATFATCESADDILMELSLAR